ncbi:hypothetical protein [Nocardia sp. XZ_19_231]|uniref:DUF6414 family protein n=1 Tax=Nocardia sp. XZ_19_231 TaxID=2769252 RepID=UPI00188EA900|nr:hypothetical protein [Nocardia sp. XZ_19_231]
MEPQESAPAPTVVVYQNSDFVSGMLQELHKTGLLESAESSTHMASSENSSTSEGRTSQNQFSAPPVDGALHMRGQSTADEKSLADRKKFFYSQSFYLDSVRNELRDREAIRTLTSLSDAKSLRVGEIVEFTAPFRANEVNAILDIATPQLTSAVVRYIVRKRGLKELNELGEYATLEELGRRRKISEIEAHDSSEFTEAVTTALRADFRGEHTKEFYGLLKELTVVTVCEAEHFITKDPDRILDGTFTVLAKVVSEVAEDVPILERNKLLNRIDVDYLDLLFQQLAESGNQLAESNKGLIRETSGDAPLFDTAFAATVEGSSVTVLPIAIYI